MAGGGGAHKRSPMGEIHYSPVRPLYRYSATLLTAGMWFWMLYRARLDGPVLLVSSLPSLPFTHLTLQLEVCA